MTLLLERLDTAAGVLVEHRIVAHHRRRLTRLGHAAVLDAPPSDWAADAPPPRAGNDLELFVDGAEMLPRVAEAIEGARSSVWLAGWFFTPGLRLRDDRSQTLRELLAAAAGRVDVRVLAWAGAPLPLFHPDRSDVRAMRDELTHGTRFRMALDARERPLHCHHEKLVL